MNFTWCQGLLLREIVDAYILESRNKNVITWRGLFVNTDLYFVGKKIALEIVILIKPLIRKADSPENNE